MVADDLIPAAIKKATAGICNAYDSLSPVFAAANIEEKIDDIDYHLSHFEIPEAQREAMLARRKEYAVQLQGVQWLPTISEVAKKFGQAAVETAIKLQLINLNLLTNDTRPLTETNIENMTPLILQHMKEAGTSLNLADLRIIFEKGVTGAYGKIYGSIGTQNICAWIDTYVDEKLQALERMYGEQKQADCYGRTDHAKQEREANHAAIQRYIIEQAEKQDNNLQNS